MHGKDTLLHPDRIAMHGVLDFRWPADADTMPWHFCAVGRGRPVCRVGGAARAHSPTTATTGPISIEHEDPNLEPEAGIDASIAGLTSRRATLLAAGHGDADCPAVVRPTSVPRRAKEHLTP